MAGHIARNCVTRPVADGGATQSRGAGQYNSLDKSRGNVKVRRCATDGGVSTDVSVRAEVNRAEIPVDTVRASRWAMAETVASARATVTSYGQQVNAGASAGVVLVCTDVREKESMGHRDVMDERAITNACASTATSEASQCVSELAPLNYVDAKINGVQRTISALDDGGTEIAVLRSDILDLCGADYVSVGSTRLRGIVGYPVDANLVKLQVQLDTDEG